MASGLLLPLGGSASTAAPDERQPLTAEEARTNYAADVRGVAAAYGISEEAAASLLATESEGRVLTEKAAVRYPDEFAGAWIADRDSGGTVVLAFTSQAAERAKDIARESRQPDRVRGATKALSMKDLDMTRVAVRADWGEFRDRGLFAMSLRAGTNKVVLHVTERSESLVRSLEERFGADRILVEENEIPQVASIPPSSSSCEALYTSCNPLRGGILLSGPGCSQGFNARRRDTGTMVVTTAGHCSNTTASHSGTTVGAYVKQQYGGTLDAQFHSVASGWSTSRWVIANNSAQSYATASVYTGTNLSNNSVCSSGRTTGPFGSISLCGAVTDHSWEGYNSEGVYLEKQFVAFRDPEPAGGDSGGPVFGGGYAFGVLWGDTPDRVYASYAYYLEENLRIDIRTW